MEEINKINDELDIDESNNIVVKNKKESKNLDTKSKLI